MSFPRGQQVIAAVGALVLLPVGVLVADVSVASASTHGTDANLQCFSGSGTGTATYGGSCSVSKGDKSVATLSNNDSVSSGDYSGVFVHANNLTGEALSTITQLGYTWESATAATPTPTPGDLSLNIGISATGGGPSTGYLYVDAYYCPGTDRSPGSGATGGTVTVVNDSSCGMYYDGAVFYANWASFVAANPTATVGTTATAKPFIVAERVGGAPPAVWTISSVSLGRLGD